MAAVILTLLGVGFIALVFTSYRLFKNPRVGMRNFITVEQLALIEGGMPELDQVIVVAHRVEAPANGLRTSVKKNLAAGVKYLFLISQSRAESEMRGYYIVFEKIAEEVIEMQRSQKQVHDLVCIQKLPYDWDDVPYIFYQLRTPEGTRTIALRGTQKHEGIDENYMYVRPRLAHTIAKTVMHGAPQPVQDGIIVEDKQFVSPANVVQVDFRDERIS